MSDYIVIDETVNKNHCTYVPWFTCRSTTHYDLFRNPWETHATTEAEAVEAMLNLTKNVWARH